MAQLCKRRTNSIVNAGIVGGRLPFSGACAALYVIGRSDDWTRGQELLAQPMPFGQEHHVAGLVIDCRYCRTSVEKSSFDGIPPTEACLTCNSQVWKDAPVLQPCGIACKTVNHCDGRGRMIYRITSSSITISI